MAQLSHRVYLLDGEYKVYVYTSDRNEGTKNLLKDLGFDLQFVVYSYGWSVEKGHMYSLVKYLDMEDKNRMVRLVRISNGTDNKIRDAYKEVCSAQVVARKRWWQYYRVKKL